DQARIQRARVAARIDALKASDRDLENAVHALDATITAQANLVAAAEQAAMSAQQVLSDAEGRLAATNARVAQLRTQVAARVQQARLRHALDDRMSDYAAEAEALAKQESGFAALIRSRELAERASRGGSFNGGPVSAFGLIWPVHGPVTSGFGMRWGRM